MEVGQEKLQVKKHVTEDGIHEPKKYGDCGYDLAVNEGATLPPRHEFPVDLPCHFSMKVPDTHFALIVSRSSTARKLGVLVLPGIIDAGYTGPIFTCVYNMTKTSVEIKKGTRLAQCVLLPKFTPPIQIVSELPKTMRGSTGFGSTDEKT